MDIGILQEEMRKLSAIVDGWDSPERMSEIERDLVLEKLRSLYDAVRFAELTSTESLTVEMPAGIDLGVVFSLDSLLPAESVADGEPAPESTPPANAASDPAPASESLQIPADDASAVAGDDEPAVAEDDASAVAEDDEPAVAGEQVVPEESAPQLIAPTLFGMDESTLRHRQKQRVIMSLYDDEPVTRPDSGVLATSPAVFESESGSEPVFVPEPASAAGNSDVSVQLETEHAADEGYAAEPAEDDPFGENPFEEISIGRSAHAETPAPGAVLGEIINHDVQTLGDTIVPHRDVASELRRGESGGDLRRSIGLNDKFLLIRDLFDGDGEACDAALETLNGFGDLDDCMIYIAENYAWNPNSDGAKFLMDLIERKFA